MGGSQLVFLWTTKVKELVVLIQNQWPNDLLIALSSRGRSRLVVPWAAMMGDHQANWGCPLETFVGSDNRKTPSFKHRTFFCWLIYFIIYLFGLFPFSSNKYLTSQHKKKETYYQMGGKTLLRCHCYYSGIPWNFSFRYIQCTGPFTPAMKAQTWNCVCFHLWCELTLVL